MSHPFIPQVIELVRAAGAATLPYWRSGVAVTEKADASPVTAADLAAHHILLDGLQALAPEVPVLSEEAADIPLAAKCVAAGARVLKHDGEALTPANIGNVLATRDLMADLRSADPFRQGGGKGFTKADRSRFLDALDRTARAAERDAHG